MPGKMVENAVGVLGLPLGLAHGWKVTRAVPAGQPVKWSDVAFDANSTAVRVRREMEQGPLVRPGARLESLGSFVEEHGKSADVACPRCGTQVAWTNVASSPIWRCEAQKGVVDGKLFVFGGFVEGMTGAVTRSYGCPRRAW